MFSVEFKLDIWFLSLNKIQYISPVSIADRLFEYYIIEVNFGSTSYEIWRLVYILLLKDIENKMWIKLNSLANEMWIFPVYCKWHVHY